MYLLPVLTLLAVTSAAPAPSKRKNCSVRSKSSDTAPAVVGALQQNDNAVVIPTGTDGVTPYIPETVLPDSSSNSDVVMGAWDRGGWSGWNKPQSTSAGAAAPTTPPATAVASAFPVSQAVPSVSQAQSAPVSQAAPPASQAVSSPASQSVAPPSSQVASSPASVPVSTAPSSTAVSTPSSEGGQTGLGLDETSWSQLTNAQGLDWYWNWNYKPFEGMQAEFVACIWGEVMANEFIGSGTGGLPQGVQYVMSFNEPDMGADVGGSNIPDVAHAASLHQQWTANVPEGVKIGAPAVARGGDVKWFTPWVTACGGQCKYDFVPIHFYGVVVEDLFEYIKSFPAGGKPIWVTEFDCQDFSTGEVCDEKKQTDFMDRAIAWFEGEGSVYVERWAWFGALPKFSETTFGLLDKGGALNEFGSHYLSL
ncbi:hypothetical protein I203_103349 [Kwoniella mangroviensis CBS 8507]|uniref:uncharacterized protein n=1 Tax=Kwoniella mangroviensis CBS 8507 TaxID=1296122 RepID=UPI00080CBD45|nr:uncharacterized protein I203_06055 [Kwoniella mangroviensis CBS 8507]OCF64811.1 hypothetical protein I203_06055 [Kwoniella mangroviensis CBS 8507]